MATAPTTVEVNGFAVRAIRKLHGIPVADLAQRVGLTRAYIANIELGHRRRVSPAVFNDLLTALSIEDRRAILNDPYAATEEPAA